MPWTATVRIFCVALSVRSSPHYYVTCLSVGVPSTSSALPSLPEPPISSKATQQRPVALLPVSNSPLRRNSLFQLVSKVATSATTAIKEVWGCMNTMHRVYGIAILKALSFLHRINSWRAASATWTATGRSAHRT